jgi:signal peptidase
MTGRRRAANPNRRRARSVGGAVLALLMVQAIVLVIAAAILSAMGYRLSVIRSGSMQPTLDVGALVVSRPVAPLELRRGDLVTFQGAAFGGHNVTHRVVSTLRVGNEVEIVTKGDANRIGERWRAPVGGRLGLSVFHVDGVGSWLAMLASGWVRVAAIWTAAVLLLRMLLGWIWQPVRRETAERPPAA